MNQEKIGKFILEQRKKMGITQAELAAQLAVTSQAVSKWERGLGIPDIEILKKLSEIFNVDIDELLEGNKKNKPRSGKNILIIAIAIFLGILSIVIVGSFLKNNYIFNSIVTDSEIFSINGVITSYKDRQSIYISEIDYKLDNDNIYEYLECFLIENLNGSEQEIATYVTEKNSDKTFNDLLKEVEFKIGNYTSMCRNLEEYKVYINIKAYKEDGSFDIFQVPLKLVDDCND